MTYPTIAVKVSFSTDRFDTPSYTTLTSTDVNAIKIEHGRHSELDGSDAGTLEVGLFNDDRKFDPNNASGTYYPNLKPGRKVQVTATYAGVTYELFNGWTTGWPNRYGLRTGEATLKASGPFAFLQRATVSDAYEAAVLADTPTGYYRFGDAEAHTITDSSGNERHGRWYPDWTDVKTADALIESDEQAVELPGAPTALIGKVPATVAPALRPMSVEFWIHVEKVPGTLEEPLYLGNEVFSTIVGPGCGFAVRIYGDTGAYPGAIEFILSDKPDASGAIADATDVWAITGGSAWVPMHTAGKAHVVCTINSTATDMFVWIDGYDYTGTISFTGGTLAAVPAFGPVDINWAAAWDGSIKLDELAFYDYELNSGQVSDHYQAGRWPGWQDTPGERIGRVLDLIGWPAGLRDLEGGQTVLGIAKDMAGTKALDYIDGITATEQGVLSEAHDDGGKLRFQDRAGKLTDSRSSTVQTLFSDQSSDLAGTACVYDGIELSTDDRPAANVVTVKWMGGDVVSTDQSSVDAYGEIPVTVDTKLESHAEAVSLSEWLLTEQSARFTRVRSITLQPARHSGTMADRVWVAALSRKVGDRVRVVHQPASTGTAIDQHLYVIGVDHDIANGVEDWTTVFYLAPAITTSYWILGTSQLGTDTRLSY